MSIYKSIKKAGSGLFSKLGSGQDSPPKTGSTVQVECPKCQQKLRLRFKEPLAKKKTVAVHCANCHNRFIASVSALTVEIVKDYANEEYFFTKVRDDFLETGEKLLKKYPQ